MTQAVPGLAGFAETPIFREYPVFGGRVMPGIPVPLEKQGGRQVNILESATGLLTVQPDYTGSDQPATIEPYTWTFPLSPRDEATWWILDAARKRGTPSWLVTWDAETEPFTAGPQLTTFALPRPFARDVITHAGIDTDYPIRAWLDGVEQDVIFTGDPDEGEVKVAGLVVTTPELTPGQDLVVRGIAAYSVVVAEFPSSYAAGGILSRNVTLKEAGTA